MKRTVLAIAICALALFAAVVSAAAGTTNNFDGYTLGNLAGQDGWSVEGGGATVIEGGNAISGKSIAVAAEPGGYVKAIKTFDLYQKSTISYLTKLVTADTTGGLYLDSSVWPFYGNAWSFLSDNGSYNAFYYVTGGNINWNWTGNDIAINTVYKTEIKLDFDNRTFNISVWDIANPGTVWTSSTTIPATVDTAYGPVALTKEMFSTFKFANNNGTGDPVIYDDINISETIVPEPGSLLALGSGLIGLAGFVIRRRN